MFDIGGTLRGIGNQFASRLSRSTPPVIKPKASSDKKLYSNLNKKGEAKKFREEIIEKDPDKNTAYLASRELLTKEAPNLLDDGATDVLAMLAADNKKSLHPEDIKSIHDNVKNKTDIPKETLDNIIKKYASNMHDIDPAFLNRLHTNINIHETPIVQKDETTKKAEEGLEKADIILTKLNDIVGDGIINEKKLNDFIGKLGNGTKTHYEDSLKILGDHKENPFLKFLATSAAINNKTLEKEDIKLFTNTMIPELLNTKLNKDLSETDIKTLITHLENGTALSQDMKSKFEKALTSDERKQLTDVINSKKALTPEAINKFCEKYMEPKIHDIIKKAKASDNLFNIKKILDTKEHKLDPKETEALDKEIVGDGKGQIKKEEWDKLSDEDKHKKRLDQKLKNEFKDSLLPEEQEKFNKLSPEEQKKMMQEKLGNNMSPEQQLELLEQHKNARQKYQEAQQKQMQERQEGTKNLMESQIAAAQQGITGAVGAINKALQGLTQLADSVSQLRANTLRAAQQTSENQARASAQQQHKMQQSMGGMGGQGYGMY